MNKTKKKTELKTKRETIKVLNADVLSGVIGGGCVTTTDPTKQQNTGEG